MECLQTVCIQNLPASIDRESQVSCSKLALQVLYHSQMVWCKHCRFQARRMQLSTSDKSTASSWKNTSRHRTLHASSIPQPLPPEQLVLRWGDEPMTGIKVGGSLSVKESAAQNWDLSRRRCASAASIQLPRRGKTAAMTTPSKHVDISPAHKPIQLTPSLSGGQAPKGL